MDAKQRPGSVVPNNAAVPPLIYVVEDQQLLLELATRVLRTGGWRVKAFLDPLVAVANFATEDPRPALLLTDYNLGPQTLNGMELGRRCRRMHPALKVIVMSGTVGEEVVQEGSITVEAFLPKPFGQKDLLLMTRSVLSE
jgi:CheY-like chemotaxis protein